MHILQDKTTLAVEVVCGTTIIQSSATPTTHEVKIIIVDSNYEVVLASSYVETAHNSFTRIFNNLSYDDGYK